MTFVLRIRFCCAIKNGSLCLFTFGYVFYHIHCLFKCSNRLMLSFVFVLSFDYLSKSNYISVPLIFLSDFGDHFFNEWMKRINMPETIKFTSELISFGSFLLQYIPHSIPRWTFNKKLKGTKLSSSIAHFVFSFSHLAIDTKKKCSNAHRRTMASILPN